MLLEEVGCSGLDFNILFKTSHFLLQSILLVFTCGKRMEEGLLSKLILLF